MSMGNGIRCVVIGDTTLPLACADLLLAQGFTLCAVITRDARVAAWSIEHGISCSAQVQDLPDLLGGQSFDYLFSIINEQILGEEMLMAPRKLAINYHDAPLPRYAGMHATSWALIGREAMHGISWHVMTAQVDAGDLLRQELFTLEDNAAARRAYRRIWTGAAIMAARSARPLRVRCPGTRPPRRCRRWCGRCNSVLIQIHSACRSCMSAANS